MNIAPKTLFYFDTCKPKDHKKVARKIRKHYLKNKKINYSTKSELTDVKFY